MPLLYASLTGGRVLAVLFFICITFAGLSSLISIIERPVRVLEDFGGRTKNLHFKSLLLLYCLSQFVVFLPLSLSPLPCSWWVQHQHRTPTYWLTKTQCGPMPSFCLAVSCCSSCYATVPSGSEETSTRTMALETGLFLSYGYLLSCKFIVE